MANVIPNSSARETALQTLIEFARKFREDVSYRTAVAGNGLGGLSVTGTNRRIYARLGASDGEVIEAVYDKYEPEIDDAILLKREQIMGLGGWLVLGWLQGADTPCMDAGEVS